MAAVRQGARFKDRRAAGRLLAAELDRYRGGLPLVLALPRGGVPVGAEVARSLDADLDVILVRKIGAPGHEEYGLGAVVEGEEPTVILNEEILRHVTPPADYIERETAKQIAEMERRRVLYREGRPLPATAGRTVIVVDDGVATGATVRAVLTVLRKSRPGRVVLAVPVAPADTIQELRALTDEIVCLATPQPFYAVGQHYDDFSQTTDAEVVAILKDSRKAGR
jgi:putative phosphoribosyl transferase